MFCGVNLSNRNGPVPTVSAPLITALAGSVIVDHLCLETMIWFAMPWKLAICGPEKFRTTVVGSGVVMASGSGVPPTLAALFFFSRSKVKATSSEVNGWPSLHLTPDFSVKVSVLLPLDHAKSFASHGIGLSEEFRVLNWYSGS